MRLATHIRTLLSLVLLPPLALTGCGGNKQPVNRPQTVNVKQPPVKVESKPEPECDPDNDGCITTSPLTSGGGSSDGYHQYIWKCSPEGKMVEDKEASAKADKWMADYERHKSELYWALRSRVLTDAEMKEVEQMGSSMLTHPMQPYMPEDVDKQFNAALLAQFRLRVAAFEAKKGLPSPEKRNQP